MEEGGHVMLSFQLFYNFDALIYRYTFFYLISQFRPFDMLPVVSPPRSSSPESAKDLITN